MCGRYALSADAQDIALQFDAKGKPDAFLPADWNISPTKNIYFVNANNPEGTQRKLEIASWGLVPSWSKDATRAANTINARVESISEKPSFRSAFKARRCLVPADGYYEWATELGNFKLKQPFYISNEDNSLLSMAGLYEDWANPQTGEVRTTVSIITRESVGEIAKVHHRMPVLLPKDRWATWLSNDALNKEQVNEYLELLDLPEPAAGLAIRPVSTAVNNARNHGPELVQQIELGQPDTLF
jgi:putative SOS response-associated peptidase YedK